MQNGNSWREMCFCVEKNEPLENPKLIMGHGV